MDNPTLALIASFIGVGFVVLSYFVKKKELFIVCQTLYIVFLAVSYFFTLQFFAMVGLAIAIVRSLICYLYERQDKLAPLWFPIVISLATLAAYLIVNLWILGDAKPLDILFLVGSWLYAFIFCIRSLKAVRYAMLFPTTISIVYNTLAHAALGVVISYVLELTANVVSIFRYHVFGRGKSKNEQKNTEEKEYERD